MATINMLQCSTYKKSVHDNMVGKAIERNYDPFIVLKPLGTSVNFIGFNALVIDFLSIITSIAPLNLSLKILKFATHVARR